MPVASHLSLEYNAANLGTIQLAGRPMLKLVEPGNATLNPSELLGIILKFVLEDRITDEEVERICTVYRDTVVEWYSVAH